MFYPSKFGEGLANSDIARQARIAAEQKLQSKPVKTVRVNDLFANKGRFL